MNVIERRFSKKAKKLHYEHIQNEYVWHLTKNFYNKSF